MEINPDHSEEVCKRGRPREFDECTALDAAMGVFWKNGYEGTSLTDLTDAMGINRPSLYAAFGSKEGLFRRVMDRYSQRARGAVEICQAEKTARDFVECMLRNGADNAGKSRENGCFLVAGAMNCGDTSEAVRREVTAMRLSTADVLTDRFERAVKEGELPPGTSAAGLADFYTAVMQGMSVRAADGAARATLHRVVDTAMTAWPGKKRSKK